MLCAISNFLKNAGYITGTICTRSLLIDFIHVQTTLAHFFMRCQAYFILLLFEYERLKMFLKAAQLRATQQCTKYFALQTMQ